jgi:hypothetical protein
VTVSGALTRRRWRWPLVVLSLLVVTGLLAALTATRREGNLDPDSAAPEGARAVVRILRAHGVRVEVVRSLTGLRPADEGTILVADPRLTPYDTLLDLAGARADVVVLAPDAVALGALGLDVAPDGRVSARTAEPRCDDADAIAAGPARAGGSLYRLAEPTDGGSLAACYPEGPGTGNGSVVVADRPGNRITVVGQTDVLRNAYLAAEGNAALALRLLGHHGTLQWYVPDPAELPTGQAPTIGELLPPWTRWVPVQLALVVLVVALWRGRRLGPLVAEPLPVVVRAAETPEGRARLYRRARARPLAAAVLRTAALRRLARRLQAATPGQLADRVVTATGRDVDAVRSVLVGRAPEDDAALVRLAGDLARIEQDVRGSTTTRDGR